MAKIVSFTCPHCGAALSVDADDRDVTCRFCQVTSVVQRAPAPQMPRPPWPVPQVTVTTQQVEAHVRKRNVLLAAWVLVPMVLLVVVSGVATLVSRKALVPPEQRGQYAGPALSPEPGAARRPARAFGGFMGTSHPLVVDANADGTTDVLVETAGDVLTGFDGKSGAELWALPKGGSGPNTHVFVSGARVIVVEGVQARLHDLATGALRATVTLDDKVDRACAPAGGKARLRLEDGSVAAIDLGTGKAAAERKGASCAEVLTLAGPQDDLGRRHFAVKYLDPALRPVRCGSVQVSGTWNFLHRDPCGGTLRMNAESLPDLEPNALVPLDGGHLLLGAKRRGRRAAMVGYAKGGKLVWSEVLSKADAAALPERSVAHAALHGNVLAAAYADPSGDRLATLDARTGARSADVLLPAPPVSVASLGDGRFVAVTKTSIVVLGRAGKLTTLVE